MAFRQSALPPLSRRYSNSQQLADDAVLVSPGRGRTSHHELYLGPVSDFGSLNTIAQSGEEELSDIIEDVVDDLDSLDDGLQAFREPSVYRAIEPQNGTILPAHDGLGSFHPATSPFAQESVLQTDGPSTLQSRFEPFSRFDDVRDYRLEEESLESSRHERIERWRLEQSKVLLEEIERERQRAEAKRRLQEARLGSSQTVHGPTDSATIIEEASTESIWQRLARHVMKDFIGVDESVLSAIFGEDLMPEEFSKTPTPAAPLDIPGTLDGTDETGLLDKLIKELRQLAQGLSSDAPIEEEQLTERLDYAGIPLSWLEDRSTTSISQPSASTQFKPTLQSSTASKPKALDHSTSEAEYWEQTPNLKTVISYLYRRFRSAPPSKTHHTAAATVIPRTQDALHRAAIIQQHHPLTSRHYKRNKKHRQSSFLSSHKTGSLASGVPHLKRPGSSCASWSTKRSRRGESSGSRNYWDLGESAGSNSMVFTGVGAWGEV